MANVKGAAKFKNTTSAGKQSFLPPKSPFPSISPSHGEYGFVGSKPAPRPREVHRHHQRTSSESVLIEEAPSWFDELLNEPETPARRGAHRRSSSDSFAYLDPPNAFSNADSLPQEECRHRGITSQLSWGSQEFDYLKDLRCASYYTTELTSFGRTQNRGWKSPLNVLTYQSSLPSPKDKGMHQGSLCAVREPDASLFSITEKHDQEESVQDPLGCSEKKEGPHVKHAQSETDTKRVKQQVAQRSRVRKLQYIAELERHVQALQAEGLEFSAELEFLDQQHVILNLENKALKQRLDSLVQEQLIKHLQQEMLEKEVARLKSLHQQHQQQPPPTQGRSISRGRSGSTDLDSQFTNLSLKHKEVNSSRDSVTGPLRI